MKPNAEQRGDTQLLLNTCFEEYHENGFMAKSKECQTYLMHKSKSIQHACHFALSTISTKPQRKLEVTGSVRSTLGISLTLSRPKLQRLNNIHM